MQKKELIKYIEQGREIEFIYKQNKYSITYGYLNGKEVISFCEFYKNSTEVTTIAELLNVSRYNTTVLEMWESITENDVWIF